MEASNTEDKNVQTRSPNKTMNSNNPKKEMQPWLLTKSVPQTSSSLSIPKSGETTTDSGNAIIVSDWPVERKTTEDFITKQTDNLDFSTHQEFITTAQPQKFSPNIEKEERFEQMQTVKPTSVDEVVFTRIDIPKRLEEEIHDLPITTLTTEVENRTSLVNLPETFKDVKVLTENATSNLTLNSSLKYSEEKLVVTKKTNKGNIESSTFEKELENKHLTTSSTDITSEPLLIQTSAPIKVKPTKDASVPETLTTESFMVETTEIPFSHITNQGSTQNKTFKTDSETQTVEGFEVPTDFSQGVTISDDEGRSPEEITLEHLFGLEERNEDESTKQTSKSTENYNTENAITTENSITLLDEHRTAIYTTLPAKFNEFFNTEDFKNDSLKIKHKTEIVKLEDINHDANNGVTNTNGETLQLKGILQTTETSYGEEETTTSDLNMNKLSLQSGKLVHDSNETYEQTTYLPETTTEIETSTFIGVSVLKNSNEEANEDVLGNFIEGKQEDKKYYTSNIDPTTSSTTEGSEFTEWITTEQSNHFTTQGLQSNTKSILNEGNKKNINIQEASVHGFVSKINAFTDSTSTPDYKQATANPLSEIKITLGETNNTDVLDKSISLQESHEQEETILNLAFDDISSENKEVIHANLPPVLELNSHVPFLQIGGDDNSESSDPESDHTTLINNIDAVSNLNRKVIHGNKETIQHKQDENKSSSSFAFTPTINVEDYPNTMKPIKQKAEEITIPTIAVVPLTPGDLKMIAEYLISEKIKPVSSRNNSIYSPNQWLKGNLTSEDNISSILSAANVSIGLMNETIMGRKLDAFNRSNQSVRFEKFEKETRYKSNSIQENKNVVSSKTDHLHDKDSDNQETLKTTPHSLEEINNGRTTSDNFSIEAKNNGIVTIPFKKIDNRSDQDLENFQTLKTEGTHTEIINNVGIKRNNSDISLIRGNDFSRTATMGSTNSDIKIIRDQTPSFSDNNQTITGDEINKNLKCLPKKENVKTNEEQIILGTTQISGLPVSEKIPYYSSITNNTDKKEINKETTESFDNNKHNVPTTVVNIDKHVENSKIRTTDNLDTREEKINKGFTQIISRMADPNEKPSASSTKKN